MNCGIAMALLMGRSLKFLRFHGPSKLSFFPTPNMAFLFNIFNLFELIIKINFFFCFILIFLSFLYYKSDEWVSYFQVY